VQRKKTVNTVYRVCASVVRRIIVVTTCSALLSATSRRERERERDRERDRDRDLRQTAVLLHAEGVRRRSPSVVILSSAGDDVPSQTAQDHSVHQQASPAREER